MRMLKRSETRPVAVRVTIALAGLAMCSCIDEPLPVKPLKHAELEMHPATSQPSASPTALPVPAAGAAAPQPHSSGIWDTVNVHGGGGNASGSGASGGAGTGSGAGSSDGSGSPGQTASKSSAGVSAGQGHIDPLGDPSKRVIRPEQKLEVQALPSDKASAGQGDPRNPGKVDKQKPLADSPTATEEDKDAPPDTQREKTLAHKPTSTVPDSKDITVSSADLEKLPPERRAAVLRYMDAVRKSRSTTTAPSDHP